MRKSLNKYWSLPELEIDVAAGRLRFDGRSWSLLTTATGERYRLRPQGEPLLLPWLMAQSFLENRPGDSQNNADNSQNRAGVGKPLARLRLLRRGCPREQWRRLSLALRYGDGASTVSSARAAVDG